mgnify:CR=1 FL=1
MSETLLLLKNLRMTLNDYIDQLVDLETETGLQKEDDVEENGNDEEKEDEDEDEEKEDEEYCPLCGIEIDVASNHWGRGKLSTGDFYCVPCYTDILEGRKTFPKGC